MCVLFLQYIPAISELLTFESCIVVVSVSSIPVCWLLFTSLNVGVTVMGPFVVVAEMLIVFTPMKFIPSSAVTSLMVVVLAPTM